MEPVGAQAPEGGGYGREGRETAAKTITERGPLLIIEGELDNTIPWKVANAAYRRQARNEGVTEIVKMPGRGHTLTIDHGRREVADTALGFV